jgi:hypothetical protein
VNKSFFKKRMVFENTCQPFNHILGDLFVWLFFLDLKFYIILLFSFSYNNNFFFLILLNSFFFCWQPIASKTIIMISLGKINLFNIWTSNLHRDNILLLKILYLSPLNRRIFIVLMHNSAEFGYSISFIFNTFFQFYYLFIDFLFTICNLRIYEFLNQI